MSRSALMLAVVGLGLSGVATAAPPGPPAAPPAPSPAAPATPPAATPVLTAPGASAPLRVDWHVDLPVTLGLGLTFVFVEGLQSRLGPAQCRWCEPHLNGFDSAGRDVRWSNPGAANTLSTMIAYGFVPVVTEGLVTFDAYRAGGWRQAADDNLVIVEAAAATGVLVEGLKFATARQRPYVRDLAAGTGRPSDANLSFPSGHTALAFSLATASGTVATLRGYPHAPWVWGTGLALATFTAYLRMAADQHYASDVIVGALTGAIVGFAVPYLLHHRWRR